MHIVADKGIPYVTEAFSGFGAITLVEGRSINRKMIAGADILLVRSVTPVTRALISGTKLKFIASATTGIEHIDLPCIQKCRIGFAYAPGSNARSVAQYVVAAIVHMAAKKDLTGAAAVPTAALRDLKFGIIGVGNIGSLVHTYAEALGMQCLFNDPPKRRLSGNTVYRPLKEVLAGADFVTLHVPLEKQGSDPTYHLVDPDFLKQMKPGAVLLNTSRGKVVDEAALKKTRPKLGGLVVDVWDNEPGIDPEICRMADIATPHIAGYSYDGKIRGTMMIHNAACSFFKNAPFWNPAELLSEQAGLIDATNAPDPVLHAVQHAYPIMRDDAVLRKKTLLNVKKRALSTGFDALRAQYPKRLEFAHYEVRCTKLQSNAAEILTKLGFMVKIS